MGAGAHRRHDIVDAAMGGLNDDGDVEAGVAYARKNAHAVEARHHEVEQHGIDGRRIRVDQARDGAFAALHHDGLVAAALHHVLDKAALDRVVISNQDSFCHGDSRRALQEWSVPN